MPPPRDRGNAFLPAPEPIAGFGAGMHPVGLLGISAHTVEMHRGNLMRDLDCSSIAQLVQLAARVRPDAIGYSG